MSRNDGVIFGEKEIPPVKAKYVNIFEGGKRTEVDCMYAHDERRVYEIASEQFNTEDLAKCLLDDYIILPNGKIIKEDLRLEF